MHLEVTFKNLRARDEIRQRADVLFEKLSRFLDPAADATLVVNVEHGKAVLDLVLNTHGETHQVIEEDEELRSALDKAFHTMEMRLRRSKEKRVSRRQDGSPADDGFVDEGSAEA